MAERGLPLRILIVLIVLIVFPAVSTKVLIDASHGQHSIDSSMYGMSRLVESLEKNGFTVVENRETITEELLKDFDILVLPSIGAGINFNESEIHAIRNFVENGGSLLVLADAFGKAPELYGDITEPYGIRIKPNLILDPKVIVEVKNFSDHLLTRDLYKIILDCGSPLNVSGSAEILAWTSESSWADNLENNGSASYNFLHDPDEDYGPFPVVAIYDDVGRVMVIGGGYLFENTCLYVAELRHRYEKELYENERFALNVFKWLARRPLSIEKFSIEFDYDLKKTVNESKPNYLMFYIKNPNSFVIEEAKVVLNTHEFYRNWSTILAPDEIKSYNTSWYAPPGNHSGYLKIECRAIDGRIIKEIVNFTYSVAPTEAEKEFEPKIDEEHKVEEYKIEYGNREYKTNEKNRINEEKPKSERNLKFIMVSILFSAIFFFLITFKRKSRKSGLYSVRRREKYRYRFR
ncbi:MAG: hypothetical protein ACE5K4_05970 [Candidatus Hydrothermarchaeota archaeon]